MYTAFLLSSQSFGQQMETSGFGDVELGFEDYINTCSSLNNYYKSLMTCVNKGFSYRRSNVSFTTPDGDEVTMRLEQSISGS